MQKVNKKLKIYLVLKIFIVRYGMKLKKQICNIFHAKTQRNRKATTIPLRLLQALATLREIIN